MNRFSTPHFIALCVACLCCTSLAAQSLKKETREALKTTAQEIRLAADEIRLQIVDALGQIDFVALEQDIQQLVTDVTPLIAEQSQALAEQLRQQHEAPGAFSFQKEKTIEKSYSITPSSKISIDNKYGKVAVHNWARNEVKVTVKIRTAESSEQRAQDALDRVQVEASKSGNNVSFRTVISAGSSSWWSSFTNGGSDRALRIDYEVYLPKGNDLALSNSYGPVEIADRDGKVAISVSYGSLNAGRLSGPSNSLAIAYSKAQVAYLSEGDVAVRYGGFTLSEAEKLVLALSYTSGSEIGRVNREADISLRYSGGFKMGLGSAIQKANVAASYSSVNIRPSVDAAFNFDVAVSYGGFDYDSGRINFDHRTEGNTSKSYSGYWNKAVNNTVSISSRYGAVSLK